MCTFDCVLVYVCVWLCISAYGYIWLYTSVCVWVFVCVTTLDSDSYGSVCVCTHFAVYYCVNAIMCACNGVRVSLMACISVVDGHRRGHCIGDL